MAIRAVGSRLGLFGVLVVALAGALSCGSEEGTEQTPGEANASARRGDCESTCAKLELCDSAATDESDCVDDCVDDRGTSPEFVEVLAECADELSCNELVDAEVDDCVGDGVRALPLSDAHESLCAAIGETMDACDDRADEAGTVDNCEDRARGLSDEYAEALEECMSESCDEIEECLATTADDFDTETVDLAEIVDVTTDVVTEPEQTAEEPEPAAEEPEQTAEEPEQTAEEPEQTAAPDDAATECLETQCSPELAACSAGCDSLLRCVGACTTETCVESCANASTPAAATEALAVIDCYEFYCATGQ